MEYNDPIANNGDGKTVAVISYITIIGWLIAYFAIHKDKKTVLGSYHLRQSLYLFIVIFAVNIIFNILISITDSVMLSYLSYIFSIGYLVLIVVGILTAARGEQKPLPLIGQKAETMFPSI